MYMARHLIPLIITISATHLLSKDVNACASFEDKRRFMLRHLQGV